MGSVYQATDLLTGQPAALKLMHAVTSPEAAYRFKREALLLSKLSHPAIVAHVAHGIAEEGQPYLVMEWLEGEDLAHRLRRQPLGLAETLSLLRRAAEALAKAHQQDIIHRDIKPSNLFLRGGQPEDVVLLDFGLARQAVPTLMGMTGSNTILGTPGYMAPEQASSQPDILPTADIFSLGCVLYECLTGQPPFAAPNFTAALAKILCAEPVPLHVLRADLPPGLQVLVDRMLAKDPKRRLKDAASLLDSLSALESDPALLLPRPAEEPRPTLLANDERQLVSNLLVSLPVLDAGAQAGDTPRGLALRDSLRAELAPYGAQVELLANGSLVATLRPERGTPTDQAALAARCALLLKEHLPEATVVLVTGLGFLDERLPSGEAMDKAGRLLHQFEQAPAPAFPVVDEVTAGLLGARFQLSRGNSGTFELRGEHLGSDESRPLLGKPTPCVGREQELTLLDMAFTTCVQEPVAQALLVTASAGMGKSRLRHEFLRRLEQRGEPVQVLLGRGDPLSAGSAQGLLGQALRGLCGIQGSEDLTVLRERLSRRVARHLPAEQAREAAGFLGELCGIPFPDDSSPQLRTARGDPQLLGPQVTQALVTFLAAECQHGAVLLVLEDLHWCDVLTVRLVDEALRELAEQPFMVLALARHEVKESFPRLWAGRLQELSLRGLSRKASARLVHEVLGPDLPDTVVGRIIEQSSGNALFLEELIRTVAEGRGEAPPETVLAMLQARLLRLEPGARRALLAASFFGRTFWWDGVAALVGRQVPRRELEEWLRKLVELEFIEPQLDTRFPSQVEYRFRHALVRDVAYGLVPEKDKAPGHRLAGAWLAQQNEPDLLVLAEHYQLGQQPEQAAPFYTRTAEQLFERGDMEGALRCTQAALACGITGEASAHLRALQASISFWRDDLARFNELSATVLPELKPGGLSWCRLIANHIVAGGFLGEQRTAGFIGLLLGTSPEPDALNTYIQALAYAFNIVLMRGIPQELRMLTGRVAQVGGPHLDGNAYVRAWDHCMRGFLAYLLGDTPWQACMSAEQSVKAFQEVGMERTNGATVSLVLAGQAWAGVGDLPRALERMREALAIAQRTGHRISITFVHVHLALVAAGSSDRALREEVHDAAREWATAQDTNILWKGVAHYVLARIAAGRDAWAEAEAHGREACAQLRLMPPYLLLTHAFLSTLLLARGRAGEAREEALRGLELLKQVGGVSVHSLALHLALAESCFAEGAPLPGEAALREALRCLRERVRDFPEPAARERFLRQVPENARLLEHVQQRWGLSWETLQAEHG
jgi:hypothetical protein